MKIKKGYNFRTIAGEKIVIPLGAESRKNHGIFKLNDAGAKLFELFQKGAELEDAVKLLTENYGVSEDEAKSDVNDFIDLINQFDMFE